MAGLDVGQLQQPLPGDRRDILFDDAVQLDTDIGHDVLAGAGGQVDLAHARNADSRKAEFLARRRMAQSTHNVPRHEHGDRRHTSAA